MNKLLRKLPVLITTCLLISLLFSCGKDDAGALDPILVSGEMEISEDNTEDQSMYVVATDINGTLLGSQMISTSGTFQIARPDGFGNEPYNLYLIDEEEFSYTLSGETITTKTHGITLYHNVRFRTFNDILLDREEQLNTVGSMKLSLTNTIDAPYQLSFGQDTRYNGSFGNSIPEREEPLFSNTNNDIYLFTTVDGTPSYQYIPVDLNTEEVALTIPNNDLRTDMVENETDVSGLPTGTVYIDFKVEGYGPAEELSWRRSFNEVIYGNYPGSISQEIPASIASYLPSDISRFSYYQTNLDVSVEGDRPIEHTYNYANRIPTSVELISDLSASLTAGEMLIEGAYDLAFVQHGYTKEESNKTTFVGYSVYTTDAEGAPTSLPESVWSFLELNQEDLNSFESSLYLTLWRSSEYATFFSGTGWGEEFFPNPTDLQEVRFDDITGTDNGGRARKGALKRPERSKGLFSRIR